MYRDDVELLKLRINARTSDEALAIVEDRAKQKAIAPTEMDLIQRIAVRALVEEVLLPPGFTVDDFLQWVSANLDSEEGYLDEDTPQPIRRHVRRAVEQLNDPLLPALCIRIGPSWESQRQDSFDAPDRRTVPVFLFIERRT